MHDSGDDTYSDGYSTGIHNNSWFCDGCFPFLLLNCYISNYFQFFSVWDFGGLLGLTISMVFMNVMSIG